MAILSVILPLWFLYFSSLVPCLEPCCFPCSSNISFPWQGLLCLLCITNRYVNLITYANTKLKQRNSSWECFSVSSIVQSTVVQIVSTVIDDVIGITISFSWSLLMKWKWLIIYLTFMTDCSFLTLWDMMFQMSEMDKYVICDDLLGRPVLLGCN